MPGISRITRDDSLERNDTLLGNNNATGSPRNFTPESVADFTESEVLTGIQEDFVLIKNQDQFSQGFIRTRVDKITIGSEVRTTDSFFTLISPSTVRIDLAMRDSFFSNSAVIVGARVRITNHTTRTILFSSISSIDIGTGTFLLEDIFSAGERNAINSGDGSNTLQVVTPLGVNINAGPGGLTVDGSLINTAGNSIATSLSNINDSGDSNIFLRFWQGTQSEYDALVTLGFVEDTTLYYYP